MKTIVFTLLLTGCFNSSAVSFPGPDGKQNHAIVCNRHPDFQFSDEVFCLKTAGDKCPNGYGWINGWQTRSQWIIQCLPEK